MGMTLAFPSVCTNAAREALVFCAGTLIPSLFPSLVLNAVIIDSSLADIAGKIFSKPFSRVFGLDGVFAVPFTVGLLSGYPAGALCAMSLFEHGASDKEQTERAVGICNNTGPSFVIIAIGSMLGDMRLGAALYACQTAAAICTGFVMRKKKPSSQNGSCTTRQSSADFSIFPSAVTGAVIPMLTICGFVIFFSVMLELAAYPLKALGVPPIILGTVFSVCEVSHAVIYITSTFDFPSAFLLTAAAVGWSGISVLLQIFPTAKRLGLSLRPYIASKLLSCILTVLFTMLYYIFLYKK